MQNLGLKSEESHNSQSINISSTSIAVKDNKLIDNKVIDNDLKKVKAKVFNINEIKEKPERKIPFEKNDVVEGDYFVKDERIPPMLYSAKKKIILKILYGFTLVFTVGFTYLVLEFFFNSL